MRLDVLGNWGVTESYVLVLFIRSPVFITGYKKKQWKNLFDWGQVKRGAATQPQPWPMYGRIKYFFLQGNSQWTTSVVRLNWP